MDLIRKPDQNFFYSWSELRFDFRPSQSFCSWFVSDSLLLINVQFLQGENDSLTESKTDKQKSDDPVVDLFPEDENEERSSEYIFRRVQGFRWKVAEISD